MHDVSAEDATYENEIGRSRPPASAVNIALGPLHIDPPKLTPHVVYGPPRGPGEIGIWPPMAMRENRAWCEYVDAVRLGYHRSQVAAFKIRS